MPTIVYNAATVQSWREKASLLTRQISQDQQTINQHSAALVPLQDRLRRVSNELSRLQSSINWAEIGLAHDRSYLLLERRRYGSYHYRQPVLGAATRFRELHKQRLVVQAQHDQISANLQSLETNITIKQAQLQRTTTELAQLNTQIIAGHTFLQTLKTDPSALVAKLKMAISASLDAYNNTHPTGLSVQARMCLYGLQEKLNYLSPVHAHASAQTYQLNYLDLCAMLQNMHAQVEGHDSEFQRVLTALLDSTHIATDGDLPDALRTGQSTASRFSFLAKQNALFAITPERLITLEEDRYEQLLTALEKGLVDGEMHKKMRAVTNSMKAEITSKKAKNEPVDYHFYTQVLADMQQVAKHPEDSTTIKHLGVLANAAVGSPSTGKKVAGALCALFGFLLIAASIACLVATFGGSALASGVSAAIGVSLITSQVCLGLAASTTAIAGTSLSFWGGLKFKDGMRQGLSNDIEQFKTEIESQPTPTNP